MKILSHVPVVILFLILAPQLLADEAKPNLDDPATRDKILAQAIDYGDLLERSALYAPNSETPYTGWIKVVDEEGMAALGYFKDGKEHGQETWWHKNGQKKQETNYKDGELHGQQTEWHENGQKESEALYKDGKQHGLWTRWHENGQKMMDANYVDGELHGLWTEWYENGQKESEALYKDGKQQGVETEWHENGNKASEAHYKDDKKHGVETEWHENGNKATEVHYEDDVLHGLVTAWHENGKKAIDANFKDGEKNGLWTEWYDSGSKKREINFKEGEPNGPVTEWDENGKQLASSEDEAFIAQLEAGDVDGLKESIPEIQKVITELNAPEKPRLQSLVHIAQAIIAEAEGNDKAVEAAYKEAFWINPDMDEQFIEKAKEYKKAQKLKTLVVPLDIEIETSTGEKTSLQKLLGDNEAIIIDFWASWCPPCMNLMDELEAKGKKLASQKVVVIGMNTENSKEIAEEVKKSKGMTIPWTIEPENEPYSTIFEISSIPQMVLITKEGRVLFSGHPSDPKLLKALAKVNAGLE